MCKQSSRKKFRLKRSLEIKGMEMVLVRLGRIEWGPRTLVGFSEGR